MAFNYLTVRFIIININNFEIKLYIWENIIYIFLLIRLEKSKNKSFLDLLLEVLEDKPDQMNDRDIREEVDTFLFEGHDTSSISMIMTLVLLGMDQDIQVRIL